MPMGVSMRRAAIIALALALGLPAAARADWLIEGAGNGHGVGMSQWGAYGYATNGRTYDWILAHYYQGTTLGAIEARDVRVLLMVQETVRFDDATKACGQTLDPASAHRFSRRGGDVILSRDEGGRLANCGGTAAAGGTGSVRLLGEGRYRGKIVARATATGTLVLNRVGIEDYVRGIVANEVSPSWPIHAVRAQAVAARSYALATRGSGPFDHYDDSRSQVYGGVASETAATDAAVRATASEVVRHAGQTAITYFFSSSGGETENKEFGFPGSLPSPYLTSVEDPYDQVSPHHRWRLTFTQAQMESRLAGLFGGSLQRIEVLERGSSPRIVRARVVGSSASSTVSGATLQSRLGTRSTWMSFDR
jgi:stage II sporulation protein D